MWKGTKIRNFIYSNHLGTKGQRALACAHLHRACQLFMHHGQCILHKINSCSVGNCNTNVIPSHLITLLQLHLHPTLSRNSTTKRIFGRQNTQVTHRLRHSSALASASWSQAPNKIAYWTQKGKTEKREKTLNAGQRDGTCKRKFAGECSNPFRTLPRAAGIPTLLTASFRMLHRLHEDSKIGFQVHCECTVCWQRNCSSDAKRSD